MSIHKLSAGSGYDYLTRQVAALDATAKGSVGLASYYTDRGECPGSWIGSGMAGIDGLSAGDPVTAEQMRSLFGAGMLPLATQRLEWGEAHPDSELGDMLDVLRGEVQVKRGSWEWVRDGDAPETGRGDADTASVGGLSAGGLGCPR